MAGYVAYGGRFSVDEPTSTVHHDVTMSMMPELLTRRSSARPAWTAITSRCRRPSPTTRVRRRTARWCGGGRLPSSSGVWATWDGRFDSLVVHQGDTPDRPDRSRRTTMSTAAQLMVECLEAEGVTLVFGIPGEENIHFVQALAAFCTDPLRADPPRTGRGVHGGDVRAGYRARRPWCRPRWGPAPSTCSSGSPTPPPTAPRWWRSRLRSARTASTRNPTSTSIWCRCSPPSPAGPTASRPRGAIPEMFRKAFKLAETERPAAVYLAVPEHIDADKGDYDLKPLPRNVVRPEAPSPSQVSAGRRGVAVGQTAGDPGRPRRGPCRRHRGPGPVVRGTGICASPTRSTARA